MNKLNVSATLKELIDRSRERCKRDYRLEERTSQPVMRLQESELLHRRNEFLECIGGFAPELDRGLLLPDNFNHCLLISDAKGFVVEAYVPANHEREFRTHGMCAGGFFDERSVGTNGIAMAISSGHIISVIGADHFHSCFHGFACSSAPLLDAQSNVIGSVTLVGSAARRSAEVAWRERVLRMTSARFQARLFSNFHAGRMTARLFSKNSSDLGYFESVASCDEKGMIVACIPVTAGVQTPVEHEDLAGRHLSELRDFKVSVRGPVQEPPSRRTSNQPTHGMVQKRKFPGKALARLAMQGGAMYSLIERARKLLAHRVPLLMCGEPGTGKAELVTLLLDDMRVISPMVVRVDCASLRTSRDLDEVLAHTGFLCEYPIENCPPVMVLLNVNRLDAEQLRKLEVLLRRIGSGNEDAGRAVSPVLIFTTDRGWRELCEGECLTEGLLFRMGQAILEVPSIRERDIEVLINNIAIDEFGAIEIAPNAKKAMVDYDWPGNLIELRAVIREAIICGNGVRINLADLPDRVVLQRSSQPAAKYEVLLRDTLDSTDWNVTRTAKLLGKSRATINRWINDQGLRRPD